MASTSRNTGGAQAPASRPGAPIRRVEPSPDSALAAEIKGLLVAGERNRARERFADLVERQQRRAVRIAYQYLRDVHDADEAVQDAFFKVFTHMTSYREDLPFEVWFTRILVNGCLDLRKTRARRLRWSLPMDTSPAAPSMEPASRERSAEDLLVGHEQMQSIAAAVDRLPDRQRTVFMLRHFGDHTPAQVGAALGLSEATVRVHLFRAVRKLRTLLER